MTSESEHQRFMAVAMAEAQRGLAEGGIPIGSVLVRRGQIIGQGHNRRVQRGDPCALRRPCRRECVCGARRA